MWGIPLKSTHGHSEMDGQLCGLEKAWLKRWRNSKKQKKKQPM